MARLDLRPRPALQPEYCKGCLRCVDACPKDCITQAGDLNATTGVRPVVLHLDDCNGCQLCIQACPEPYGLVPQKAPGETASGAKPATAAHDPGEFELEDPTHLFGAKTSTLPAPVDLPGLALALPTTDELMAKVLPHLGGSFVQAVSEVAAINMMYGCAGAGLPCMTFTSSPGFSLMLEGISYMIGAELPGVVMNVMRGGPGLGNIAPEQADIKLMTRGLGHGNTHAIVLAPSTPQEMLDLSRLAFELAFAYRNPVIIAADGYLGQMAGVVRLPATLTRPGLPAWAVWGDRAHRMNLVCSIQLSDTDLEAHNHHLNDKYADITKKEQRAETWLCDDAEVLLVACNTPARMAKGAVMDLREAGVAAGLVRPITLWPFPIDEMRAILTKRPRARVVVVEASPGQLEDELRLALSHAGLAPPPIQSVRRMGGVLPQRREIVAAVLAGQDVAASGGVA